MYLLEYKQHRVYVRPDLDQFIKRKRRNFRALYRNHKLYDIICFLESALPGGKRHATISQDLIHGHYLQIMALDALIWFSALQRRNLNFQFRTLQ